jgi:hypothetical protein
MKFNYQQFEAELETYLAQDLISGWQAFGIGHYRINGELDIWPKNRKFGWYLEGYYGEYRSLRRFF